MRNPLDKKHPIERAGVLLVLIVVLTPIILLGWAFWRDSNLAKGFAKIADGATRRDVVRLMGKPKKVEKCGEFFGPIPQSEMGGCVREYLYTATFAPYAPQYYVVRFDGSDHVIGKTPYSSP
jgi:hypothetical protein